MRLTELQQITLANLAVHTVMESSIPLKMDGEMESFLLAEKLVDENFAVTLKGFNELRLNNVSLGIHLEWIHVYKLGGSLFKEHHSYEDVFNFVSVFGLHDAVSLQVRAGIAFDVGIEIPEPERVLSEKFDELENQYRNQVMSLMKIQAEKFYMPVDANSNKQNTKMWNKLVSELPINGSLKLFTFSCKVERKTDTDLFLVIPHPYKTVPVCVDRIKKAFEQTHGSGWKLNFRTEEVGV